MLEKEMLRKTEGPVRHEVKTAVKIARREV